MKLIIFVSIFVNMYLFKASYFIKITKLDIVEFVEEESGWRQRGEVKSDSQK